MILLVHNMQKKKELEGSMRAARGLIRSKKQRNTCSCRPDAGKQREMDVALLEEGMGERACLLAWLQVVALAASWLLLLLAMK